MQVKKTLLLVSLVCLFLIPAFAVYGSSSEARMRAPPAKICNITSPANGEVVSGIVTITIDASKDPVLMIDGATIGKVYSYQWDTTAYANGDHTLFAKIGGAEDTVVVTVDNGGVNPPPNEAPIVSVTSPTNGETVTGMVDIAVSVTDEETLTSDIYIDGSYITTANYYTWDTTAYADGTHTIYAEASDSEGLSASDEITIAVQNTQPPQDNILESGVTDYGSLSDDADYYTWEINVGPNANTMHVVLNSGSADFDFFASYTTSDPTHSNNIFEGYTTGGEDVSYSSPTDGTWYIKVDAYSGAPENYDITVTITYNEPLTWGTGGKYAIVIGISDYQSISDLNYCDEDATDWYNFLTGEGYEVKVYGDSHPSNYPRYDDVASVGNVRNAIQSLAVHAQPGDDVVITTSGHGGADETSGWYYDGGDEFNTVTFFLCMWDAFYYEDEFVSDIDLFTAGVSVTIVIDHCHSGGIESPITSLDTYSDVLVLTTCSGNGYGYDVSAHSNGKFTYWMLEAFAAGMVSWEDSFNWLMNDGRYLPVDNAGDNPQIFDGNTGLVYVP